MTTGEKGIAMATKAKEKLTPEQWQARFNAAADVVRREYCHMFKFWQACRYKPCRRATRCSGDARACLARGIERVPYDDQFAATNRIIATTAADADEPTRTARWLSMFSHAQ
jgi:hypothetical protein